MTRSPALAYPLFLLCVLTLGACGSAARGPTPRPAAEAVLTEVGDNYAELERIADSVTAETDTEPSASSELAQVTARNLAGRIDHALGGFEAITLAMSTDDLERTRSMWVRLAATEAALQLLYEDATRLASDPAATADELYALSTQLSGSLELGRVSSRMAATQVQPDAEPEPATP
jgi:hypothetical protein